MNFLDKLLDYYNISSKQYEDLKRDPSLGDVPSFNVFEHINEVKERILLAIKNKEKILIYGDYDADGIMGTSILVKMLEYAKYSNVTFYIPNRYKDGYGINLVNAEKIAKQDYELVICVDNGISAFEPIKYLREHNIDVLVLDHHEMQSELPNANVIIHPFYSEYGEYSCSGAFVAFVLILFHKFCKL